MKADEIIQVQDQFYILATSSLADDRTRVLKDADTFALFDRYGDVQPVGLGEQGLYHEGTRFLSSQTLSLGDARPLLLSSNVRSDNLTLAVDLTNPDMQIDGEVHVPRGSLHIYRSKLLWAGVLHERLRVTNYARFPIGFALVLRFAADFADIFEVRGTRRPARGERLEPRLDEHGVTLAYRGLDGVERRTRIVTGPVPVQVSADRIRFEETLQPRCSTELHLTIACENGASVTAVPGFEEAREKALRLLDRAREDDCHVETSNEQFNGWLGRSLADLHMMLSDTGRGPYPYAGVPWFSTVFGRDGIVTALQTLWINPAIGRGVLAHLAALQAREPDEERDAQPGKILHEQRRGEMAALGEVPFGLYYGSIDSTPLFVLLAAAYTRHTGDLDFARGLWPAVEAALRWLEDSGDEDHDGLIEYRRRSSKGLLQQGWKDSNDSIFHADGELAEGPIALCEVQAYAYAAWSGAAWLARALGHDDARELDMRARRLRTLFEERFWSEELSTYVLALDGAKRPCNVVASNAGHALLCGIASPERARLVAGTLLTADSFSGWGVRTLSSREQRYDPMSYHNGSVWPHDNALIAAGMARYGLKTECLRILQGLFEASTQFELNRLPELFCGFERRPGEGPTQYPVACSPQSWAAGAVFLLLQASLGLEIDGRRARLSFRQPRLPRFLERVRIEGLQVGGARLDLTLSRMGQDVSVHVTRRRGDAEVAILS